MPDHPLFMTFQIKNIIYIIVSIIADLSTCFGRHILFLENQFITVSGSRPVVPPLLSRESTSLTAEQARGV